MRICLRHLWEFVASLALSAAAIVPWGAFAARNPTPVPRSRVGQVRADPPCAFAGRDASPVATAAEPTSAVSSRRAHEDRAPADLILRGGAVYTVDAARSWAEAVAIRGEQIVYVGPSAGMAEYVAPKKHFGVGIMGEPNGFVGAS